MRRAGNHHGRGVKRGAEQTGDRARCEERHLADEMTAGRRVSTFMVTLATPSGKPFSL